MFLLDDLNDQSSNIFGSLLLQKSVLPLSSNFHAFHLVFDSVASCGLSPTNDKHSSGIIQDSNAPRQGMYIST